MLRSKKKKPELSVYEVMAYAKINLALDVLRKLPNGFHEVKMIMQQVLLHDVVKVGKTVDMGSIESLPANDEGIYLTTNREDLPVDKQNLAYRAAKLVKNTYGIDEDVTIHIDKNIPIAAGLAGGSTDAAAVLKGMNQLFQLDLSEEELCQMGTWLGADVPFCIQGGAALAEGIGEKLTPLKGLDQKTLILLCKPPINISTKEVYQNYSARLEEMKDKPHPDVEALRQALESGEEIKEQMVNVLEYITLEEYPIIQKIKNKLKQYEAEAVLMSGSGPTVFGIFKEEDNAMAAYDFLKQIFPETYLTRPQERDE